MLSNQTKYQGEIVGKKFEKPMCFKKIDQGNRGFTSRIDQFYLKHLIAAINYQKQLK